jgi:hypothetical protein
MSFSSTEFRILTPRCRVTDCPYILHPLFSKAVVDFGPFYPAHAVDAHETSKKPGEPRPWQLAENLREHERSIKYRRSTVLASGALATADSVGRFPRNMPDPIPRWSCLVDWPCIALFRDCALRVVHAADTIGIRGIVVQAISDRAKAFYQALGFDPSPADP